MAEAIDYTKRRCKQQGCTLHDDGVCLEGLPLDQCTHHFEFDGSNAQENVQENPTEAAKQEFEEVYSADTLSLNETVTITSAALTRFVILAGSVDSGKTTFLAALLDLFQTNSSFGDFIFAGSKTLIGFEKRCHGSRIASGQKTPKTERTLYTPENPRFLHLKLCDKRNSTKQDLIFTDISGEHFEKMTQFVEESKKFTIGLRADHFVLFIDSDTISVYDKRQNCKTESLGVMRSLIEGGMLDELTQIQVVFSRWDLLESKNEKENHIAYVEEIKKDIIKKFGGNERVIQFFEIATRPDFSSQLKLGHGLEPIIEIWANESRFNKTKKELPNDNNLNKKISKEYLKFKHQ